jgi:hypothetical protein
MPLTPGDAEPEVDTWGIDFDMIAPNGDVVSCFVMRGALDQLNKGDGSITIEEQLAVFAQWREVIEATASQKYDGGILERGMVVVRPEDVKMARGTMQ